LKILYHHRTLGDGAEGIHVAEMIKAFRKLGHEVKVVSLIGEQTNVATKKQGNLTRLKKLLPGFLFELGEIAYNLHGYRSLSRAVKIFQPDFIYDRYISYNYSAVAVGRRYGLPVLLEVNSPYSYQKQTFDEKLLFKNLSRTFERRICQDASKVITVSTPLKKFLISVGVPESKIVVMPNGADPDVFDLNVDSSDTRKQIGAEGKIIIGFTGILRPWHGLELLMQAFEAIAQKHEQVHLLIVGDGPIRGEIEADAEKRGLSEKVTITGRQNHNLVNRYVAAMDIAVSPRATFYASPMKILEYMAMGKAIVAPDMENIRDLLKHKEDGFLFQEENISELTTGLQVLIEKETFRKTLGENARKKIENERTWSHNARDVIALVKTIQNQKKESPE